MPYAWTPTAADVADVIPQRPVDADGLAGGAFTANTVPTDSQVERLAAKVAEDVAGALSRVGTLTTDLEPQATAVAAVGAASYVELGFFPEQSEGATSPAQQLWERYEAGLARLLQAVEQAAPAVPTVDTVPDPVYSFPDAVAWPA